MFFLPGLESNPGCRDGIPALNQRTTWLPRKEWEYMLMYIVYCSHFGQESLDLTSKNEENMN